MSLFFSILISSAAALAASPVNEAFYESHKHELGRNCSGQAGAYCGKKTRDARITLEEAQCLGELVFRLTRDRHPIDESSCAKTMRKLAAQAEKETPLETAFNAHAKQLGTDCAGPAARFCDKKTKSMTIEFQEFACLHRIAVRRTRDRHPLDGTTCAKAIHKIAGQIPPQERPPGAAGSNSGAIEGQR